MPQTRKRRKQSQASLNSRHSSSRHDRGSSCQEPRTESLTDQRAHPAHTQTGVWCLNSARHNKHNGCCCCCSLSRGSRCAASRPTKQQQNARRQIGAFGGASGCKAQTSAATIGYSAPPTNINKGERHRLFETVVCTRIPSLAGKKKCSRQGLPVWCVATRCVPTAPETPCGEFTLVTLYNPVKTANKDSKQQVLRTQDCLTEWLLRRVSSMLACLLAGPATTQTTDGHYVSRGPCRVSGSQHRPGVMEVQLQLPPCAALSCWRQQPWCRELLMWPLLQGLLSPTVLLCLYQARR